MHHANVDRLFAIWQAINYQQPLTFSGSTYGEMGTPAGPTSQEDPLKPFYNAKKSYHTSSSISSIQSFTYSYPEIPFWNHSASDLSQACKRSVNALYGGGSNSLRRRDAGSDGSQSAKYFAQLTLQREMLPLPCTVSVVLEGQEAGRIALLAVPSQGVSHGEIALEVPSIVSSSRADRLGRRVAPTADVVRSYFGRSIHLRVLRVCKQHIFPPSVHFNFIVDDCEEKLCADLRRFHFRSIMAPSPIR